jgi:NAD(P)-dependent dehydrogenase (short-subunit alcohol dehydrogenase family)
MAPYLVTQACIPMLRRHNELDAVKARVMNIASWAGVMASPFIGFYNAAKYGLAGLTESMYYDLGLLDIHAVLAIPGITKTSLLTKTTGTALASLDIMPPEAQARYRPHLEHLAGMNPDTMRMLRPTPVAQVADKITAIIGARRPHFKYDLAADARLIDGIITRLLPFTARASMTRRMYRLNQPGSRP